VAAFSHIPRALQVALVTAILLAALAAAGVVLVAHTFSGRYAGDDHPDSRLAQLAGGPVRYVEAGTASPAQPLLLLHGYQGTLSQWNDTWTQLQSCSARRIRIDVPGFGHSVWASRDFSLDTQADRIVALLDHLGIERVTLAGTSMGGSLAAAVAARHPERIAQLALFAPSAFPGSLTYDGLFGILVKPGVPNRMATWIAGTALYRRLFPTNIATETLTLTASYDEHWAESLRSIRAPTLIAWSTSDRTADVSAAPKVHAAIAASTLLMLDAGTGHSIPNARPDLTAALLCELANGTPPQGVLTDSVTALLHAGETLDTGAAAGTTREVAE
jgi:pimeloyl-ACP methyl ester carboxylesterase